MDPFCHQEWQSSQTVGMSRSTAVNRRWTRLRLPDGNRHGGWESLGTAGAASKDQWRCTELGSQEAITARLSVVQAGVQVLV